MKRQLTLATALVVLMVGADPGSAQNTVDLQAYAGRYPWDQVEGVSFLDNPAVKSAVAGALIDPDLRQMLLADTGSGNAISIPVIAVGDYLYMRAFEAASGGDVSWGLLVSRDGSDAVACFSGFGEGGAKTGGNAQSSVRSFWYADGDIFLTRRSTCPGNEDIQDEVQYRVLPALATLRGEPQYEWCFGVLNTGSGMAGSAITGDGACFIPADSDAQRLVTHTCGEGKICLVEALVSVDGDDGQKLIREVLSVNQAIEQAAPVGSYLEQAGSFADGIYANGKIGCDAANGAAHEQVSIHLSRKARPAVQLGERYCAVIDAAGDAPNPEGFQTTLQIRCGSSPDEDAALRGGAAGKADIVVLNVSSAREISLQDSSLLRCPIRQSSAPEWWLSEPPANVRAIQF
ncbi:hypothetical protein [Nitratireductor indicus]|uniref:hypothetical protein n=1 Tax=Nitratireductor indicus TaxID=721133 RepID=UPI0028743A98|nr:hypothetical protein [Nitratireductor indicus]MDS1136236.1 hypothetical protein [Nitratireductor indicus]